MDLEQQLESARSSLTVAQPVKPEAHELEAIKAFCHVEIQRRNNSAQHAAQLKLIRLEIKAIKQHLTDAIKPVQGHCLMLSKSCAKRIEQLSAAAGLPSMPPYLRLITNAKDLAITPEIIQESLEAITTEDLAEAAATNRENTPKELLKQVVLDNIRRSIRSFSETLRLVPNLPRGITVYEIPEAPIEIADRMYELWVREMRLKTVAASRRTDPEETKELESLKAKIETFFTRTGLTAQRIVVDHKPYRLVKRVSIRKVKVGMSKFETMLDSVLQDVRSDNVRPVDIIRGLQIALASVPPETKTSVALCAVKAD